jgi:processive 1,2-diacylglycerol beta-glucosyltransferase
LHHQLLEKTASKARNILNHFPYNLLFATISRYLKEKKINAPTFALVTDTGEVHINWVSDDIDYYFVPTKDTGFFLEERGVDHDRIKVFGFPVRQQFYKKFDAEEVKEKYNLPKDKKIVMVFSGAWGSGKIKRKVDELEKALKDTIILVICGKNRTLKSRIRHGGYRHNKVIPVGFLHDVAEFMTMADVVVSKAGGISIMELVTMKKPIVVTEIFPGQEEPNAKFIESMGFGYIEKDPEDLAKRVKFMLETDDLERIKSNYSKYHVNEKSDKSIANFIHEIVGNEEIDADEATQVSETI